jgi:hypothetical protein
MNNQQQKYLRDRIGSLYNKYRYPEPTPPTPEIVLLQKQIKTMQKRLDKLKAPGKRAQARKRERLDHLYADARAKVLFIPADKALAHVERFEREVDALFGKGEKR